tara:strand:+ start:5307 stop:5963 length:657 start_codon:yes stop_codon:yes gene_type:complete
MKRCNVEHIRKEFIRLKENKLISDNGTYEILNASFISNDLVIFGELNEKYVESEVKWYLSESRNINDIEGKIPSIWKEVATKDGLINSNYGWCILSEENGSQFVNALDKLKNNKLSRQATMIYIRPSMHADAVRDGMNDFMCTYSAQLMIRNDYLYYHVYMRSNDAVFGYKNDSCWHHFIHEWSYKELKKTYKHLRFGPLFWNAATLHIYPRHFDLIK